MLPIHLHYQDNPSACIVANMLFFLSKERNSESQTYKFF